ncbi:MAG: hypothetical protein IM516_03365 [Pseudanabaena sp. M158S2SP1A06QC]|jgi:hypothetical protein|nr:hypothetical protein [Pseudanabaena sp. M051S1SP1A06QC]MCA6589125.1 hypothetical protein [Pseudanabaena sp. M109S1SP1A06QC]MCA6605064.1 hypothetical protein [Pseudanabaena sp. M007S1SP1A06QC]MCA6611153.1 hypothetical protein [Pseudanabaena sp. M158S2SP1A06QC]MCA6614990.1 hypothetical protein [Pseudanabaena sp. M090S1SP1A06QC]MCA6623302.1 hypothetical protein [Pseudanabaena sp. M165S2SP1A06QC]MCE2974875.1 hypothetical protein [Pseudanabaena sp. CoA8_M7]
METKFDFSGQNLFTPIVFREDFNQFAKLSETQAWSLFFTVSREDSALGFSRVAGRFWTSLVIATVIESILGVVLFHTI